MIHINFKQMAATLIAMLLTVNLHANATLYVPAGSKAVYEAADYWNDFKEIEDKNGATIVSEGIDSNYMYIINYSVFGVIKLTEE